MLAIFLPLVVFAFCFYACASQRHLRKEIDRTPRDPITGVATGTEALTLAPTATGPVTSGTACLLVHGFLSARSDFADLGPRLAARGVAVRMLRLPGHGTTPVDFAYLSDGALYRAVEQEYRNLREQYDRVYVAGFSMGGSLATLLASKEDVDGAILIAPYYGVSYEWYYILPPEWWNSLLGWAVPYMIRPRFFIKLNKKENRDKFFFYGTVPSRGVRQLTALGREARSQETLSRVRCPVLMIHGEGDGASSPSRARAAFQKMASPSKEALWLERSNHVIFWDYEAEEAKERIEQWILREAGRKP